MFAGKLLGGFFVGLLVASLTVPVAHADSSCDGADEPTRTFKVRVRVGADAYELGENAKFYVTVNRVVEGQDMGPVAGAEVAVGVSLGDVYLTAGGWTEEDGRAVVKVRLKNYAPPGLADVLVFAQKMNADLPCHMQQYENEYGDVEKLGLFRVVR